MAIHPPPAVVSDETDMFTARDLWRMSVDQYHQMIDAGILTTDDRVELIEGWLVETLPKNPPHTATTDMIHYFLETMLPDGWIVRSQDSITLKDSEQEPDIALVKGIRREFFVRHPHPAEIALLIEVADSSLKFDKGRKKCMYATAGIPIYGVLSLAERQLYVYSNPTNSDYQETVTYGENDEMPIVIDGEARGKLSLKSILP